MATTPSPPARLGHRPVLDGVRGVAIGVILVGHAATLILPATGNWIAPGAYLGVDLFFVLSGFLITTLLYEERRDTGRVSAGGFYGRRAARLLPALIVLLAAHFSYSMLTGVDLGLEVRTVGLALGYVLNWAMSVNWELAGGLGHLWSLSIEEQFYLVWPWVVLGLALLTPRRAAACIAVGIVASAAMRWHITEAGDVSAYHRTDTRADALLAGALAATMRGQLALVWHTERLRRAATLCALLFAVAVLIPNIGPSGRVRSDLMFHGGFTVVALAVALVIVAAVEAGWDPRGALTHPWLRLAGRVSYGLYLWHAFIAYLVVQHLQHAPAVTRFAVWSMGTVAVTAASWQLVERPTRSWARSRLTDRRAASSAPGRDPEEPALTRG